MNTLLILKNAIVRQKDSIPLLLGLPAQKRGAFEYSSKMMRQNTIKVITGPRRAGKSTFALSLMKDMDFVYLNFDDQDLSEVTRHQDLDSAIEEVYGKNIKHIFVDEIQNLVKFELWLNSLHRRGYNIVATGSNANLLSRELATHLTGRHVEIEILPFSYVEYGGDFDTFYKLGGFPDILLNGQEQKSYMEGLHNSVILKDIVNRFKLRNQNKLLGIFKILAGSVASLFSYKNLARALDIQSEVTVRKYVDYLTDTYLYYQLLPFSEKVKQFYRSPKKGYVVDIASIQNTSTSEYSSKKLENFVFTELIKSGLKLNQDLFYGKTKNGFEVDFMIKKDFSIQSAIQVCFSLENMETREREVRALVDASSEWGVKDAIIVTWNHAEVIEEKGVYIRCVPIKEFLSEL